MVKELPESIGECEIFQRGSFFAFAKFLETFSILKTGYAMSSASIAFRG